MTRIYQKQKNSEPSRFPFSTVLSPHLLIYARVFLASEDELLWTLRKSLECCVMDAYVFLCIFYRSGSNA